MKRLWLLISLLMISFLMQACGGGGAPDFDATSTSSSSSASTASVAITKSALQFNETTSVSATFKQAGGLPAAGIAVNFTTTLGTLNPADGLATTDANGVATIQLTAGASSGQGQITASATIGNSLVTKIGQFSVTLPPLKLANMSLGLSTLSFGGSTSVSVTVTDANGATYTAQPVDVVFTSTQVASGNATISSPVTTVNGVATATYKATTATGSDTITATISGSSATVNITINPLGAGSISFLSATPANIGLKGMGGAGISETSVVTFKVFDTAGQPKANQQVDFALNTVVGGLSMSQSSGSTAADGTVSTIVQAGVIATPVRVTATLRGISPAISTQSDQLVVSTGVPAQDGFSISIATLNPECFNIDGVTDTVTARLSDHFHNPVPDGTAVSFTTNGGVITPSCTTVNGACSVTWTSQDPRPVVPGINVGRVTILAYAVGEEAFLDVNGNGAADSGEFTDNSEAFRDDNENGVRGASETFIDFNGNGAFDMPDGRYNGVLQGAAFIGAPRSKHAFQNSRIVMATSGANITSSIAGAGTISVPNASFASPIITVSDLNGNTMPLGTKVSFSIKTFTQNTSFVVTAPDESKPFVFPNSAANVGTAFPVRIDNPGTGAAPNTVFATSGVLTVTVTSPGGLITTQTFSVTN